MGYGSDVTIRVLLIDDHEVVRRGIGSLLSAEDDLEVVGEAEDGESGIRRVGFDNPDVVLLDVRLPDMSGVDACSEIKQRFPATKVVMLTAHTEPSAVGAAIRNGADGFLLKQLDGAAIVAGIREVAAGRSAIDPELTATVFAHLRGELQEDPRLSGLNDRERRILDLMARGMTNRQIADDIYLAEKTVKNYVSGILRKLDMATRTEAAAFMARIGAHDASSAERWQ